MIINHKTFYRLVQTECHNFKSDTIVNDYDDIKGARVVRDTLEAAYKTRRHKILRIIETTVEELIE